MVKRKTICISPLGCDKENVGNLMAGQALAFETWDPLLSVIATDTYSSRSEGMRKVRVAGLSNHSSSFPN